MTSHRSPPWLVMSYFALLGIATYAYIDVHPDWFFISGGSAPQGVWRIVDANVDAPLTLGSWVVVCPPLNEGAHRQLFETEPPDLKSCGSQPSLKQIAAIPGDRVSVEFPNIHTPLRSVTAVKIDARGDPLPRPLNGVHAVAEDTYWVLSEHERSVDSRYYGPISTADIENRVDPFWIKP